MDRFTRVTAVLVGVLGASGGLSAALVACGTTSPGTGGPDGSNESGADHHVVSNDTGTHDSGHDVVIKHDTGVDTGVDAGTDTGADTGGVDTGVDSGRDSGHDSGHDAGFDATGAAEAFPTAVIHAYCQRMSECCVGDASAKFDMSDCVKDNFDTDITPLVNLGPILRAGLGSSQYKFDEANASACLAAMAGLACTTNPASTIDNLITLCNSAYTPLATIANPSCASMFDCPTGTYCSPLAVDTAHGFAPYVSAAGGVGTCVALQTVGQPCADYSYSTDCNYQGAQVNALYCNGNAVGGTPLCEVANPTGGSCANTDYNPECQSGQCVEAPDANVTCVTTVPFNLFYGSDECQAYKVDGG